MLINFFSPLEQFSIHPVISIMICSFDFSLTNATFFLTLILFVFVFFVLIMGDEVTFKKDTEPFVEKYFLEVIYNEILILVVDNIKGKIGQVFFPLVFFIFTLILFLNVIGLIPYTFTLTSHLSVTLGLSLATFIGINIICTKLHGLKFFSLFLPSGTSVGLAFLLVPIELISYVFKPISLSIRLFANMMAGHTLLKVIAGFSFTLMSASSSILFLIHYIPLLILIPLFVLELGVALIQSFVFSILICIYLNDAINLH